MSRPPTTGAIPGDVNRIRRALYDLIATLKQAPGYNNFEWGAFIFLAPNGAIYASPATTIESPNDIRLPVRQLVPSGSTIIAYIHTHPGRTNAESRLSEEDVQQINDLLNISGDPEIAVDPNMMSYVVGVQTDQVWEYTRADVGTGPAPHNAPVQVTC